MDGDMMNVTNVTNVMNFTYPEVSRSAFTVAVTPAIVAVTFTTTARDFPELVNMVISYSYGAAYLPLILTCKAVYAAIWRQSAYNEYIIPATGYHYGTPCKYTTNLAGLKCGWLRSEFVDGTPSDEMHYVAGELRDYKKWYGSGVLREHKYIYGSYPRYIKSEWFANGTMSNRSHYNNNMKDGKYKTWDYHGRRHYKTYYVNDKENGVCRWWHHCGTVGEESRNYNGVTHGKLRKWRKSGDLKLLEVYVHDTCVKKVRYPKPIRNLKVGLERP